MKETFTKKDLRTGDIIVTRNEGNAIYLGKQFRRFEYLSDGCIMANLDDYNDDLTSNDKPCSGYNIQAVYRIIDLKTRSLEYAIDNIPNECVELIWERQSEIDWTKVPKFTKVQVRDYDDQNWKNRYFLEYNKSAKFPYNATKCGEFSYEDGGYSEWKQIRIYDESDIKDSWYKN